MKYQKTIAIYSILVGIGVMVIWIMLLLTGDFSEGWIEMGFHLYAEFAMAIIMLVSGIMNLRKMKWAREINIGALGMVIYSVINAAGYYGQRGETYAMILFIFLALLSILAMSDHFLKSSA